jgi:hypothetical protein
VERSDVVIQREKKSDSYWKQIYHIQTGVPENEK